MTGKSTSKIPESPRQDVTPSMPMDRVGASSSLTVTEAEDGVPMV